MKGAYQNNRHQFQTDESLESRKDFQSMLFLTPPKIHDLKSPEPSPSPLIGIMQSLTDMLADDEEKIKAIYPELIKLLENTPVQQLQPQGKQFVPKKSSRNISTLFWEEKQPKASINQKFSQSKTVELPSSSCSQPFYPTNYNHENMGVPTNLPSSSYQRGGNILGQVQIGNNQNPKFQSLKLPVANTWNKKGDPKPLANPMKKESKCGANRRATSINSNTSNKENLQQVLEKEVVPDENADPSFSFPDGGWVCSFCQNYNFYGRVKCNRWSKVKTKDDCEGKPQHIIRKEMKARTKKDENNMNHMNKKKVKKTKAVKIQPVEVPPSECQVSEGNMRLHSERVGDWVWFSCNNLNFSFRKIWNRCKLTREESDMQYAAVPAGLLGNCAPLIGFSFPGVIQTTQFSNEMDPSQSYSNN